jgi:hypothetical protein
MADWDFTAADKEMAVAGQILALRDQMAPNLSLDGTVLQDQFETAATASDLDGLLALAKNESGAAGKIDGAAKLRSAGTNPLQAIGLLGADPDRALGRARSDLQAGKPDTAASEAQAVTDQINGSATQGLVRAGATVGILAILLLVVVLWRVRSRKRHDVETALAEIGATIAADEAAAAAPAPAEAAQTESPEPPAT